MKNVSEKKVVDEIKIHILRSVYIFFENHALYEVMWKHIAERVKVKFSHNRPRCSKGFPRRLRHRILFTFSTTRVVGRQPYAPGHLYPRRNPWYSFLEAESTPGLMVLSVAPEKILSDTTGNQSQDRPTSSAVP
jgi:hypothetical protein